MNLRSVIVCSLILCVPLVMAVAVAQTAAVGDHLWINSASTGRGELVTSNPGQGLEARLGPAGLTVTPTDGDWELGLALARSGREGALAEAAPATPRAAGTRAELDRGDIIEWWVNSELGLEHGFTVRERAEGEGPLVLELELAGDLLALPEPGELGVALMRPGNPLAVLHYGDLDLAAGNLNQANRVYENTGGSLASAWTSADSDGTLSVAWGDWDSDGDLDLAAGNHGTPTRVYENGFLNSPGGLPETPTFPELVNRPGTTDSAFGYSTAEYLVSPVMIPFTLVDEQGDGAPRITTECSPNGGGQWLPATGYVVGGDPMAASSVGVDHEFLWYFVNDGMARAENVVFRIAVTWQAPDHVSAGLQRGSMAATSPPFRVWDRKADLVVTLSDGQESAVPGEALSYTIMLSNLGPNDVDAAQLVDAFPPALLGVTWTCDDSGGGICANAGGSGDIDELVGLPVGTSVVFTADATVDPGAGGLLENTASATLPNGITELEPSDNSTTDIDLLIPSTDLWVTLDDGVGEAVPGEGVSYSIVVNNTGPSDAVAAQVVDLFPAELVMVDWTCGGAAGGTCTAAGTGDIDETVDLPVGASVTFTVNTTIDPAATGVLVNTASVLPPAKSTGGDRGDPDPGDNVATDVDTLMPEADLAITKDDGTDMSVLGRESVYTITAFNPGPSDAPSAMVSDIFPAELGGVTWTCTGSDGGACAASGSGDINESVDLPAGASVVFTATATVDPGATGAALENTATTTCPAAVTERNPADNTSTDTNTLWEVIFEDGFESGDTEGWD